MICSLVLNYRGAEASGGLHRVPPELQRLLTEAEQRHDEATLDRVAANVGVGVRSLQCRQRTADLAKRRAVVAWILHDQLHWPQRRVARGLARSVRQIRKMLRKTRVSSALMRN